MNLEGFTKYSIYSEKILWPVFFIWPFMAFMLALSNYRNRTSRIIVYLFMVLYGLTFVIPNVGVDSWEYAQKLIANANRPFRDFWNVIGGQYAYDTSVDFIEPFVSFFVSRFTEKHYLLFGVYATIFGFFYMKSINYLHDRHLQGENVFVLILIICFALVNPIFNINGFRFYTAAWIFFFGAFNLVLTRDWKFLIIALSACLVHFSFLSAGAVLIAYYLAGNRNFVYYPILIVSFILPNLLAPYLNSLLPSVGAGLQSRIEGYTNEDYIQAIAESSASMNWFMQAENYMFYFLLLAIVFLKLRHKEISKKPELANLYSFMLVFLAFVNFGKTIPSVGRFQTLFILFGLLYILLILTQVPSRKGNIVILIGLFPMLLLSFISLRIGLETVNFRLFEPMTFMFWGEDTSLWSVLFR